MRTEFLRFGLVRFPDSPFTASETFMDVRDQWQTAQGKSRHTLFLQRTAPAATQGSSDTQLPSRFKIWRSHEIGAPIG